MAIKLADTLAPMSEFPAAMAEHIGFSDGATLQEKFDNKELGGGDSSVTLTQEEYEALPEEEKLDGLYYTYDTKRIYKNGVQYGASEPIPLTMEEYKALKEAGAIDEKQEYLIEAGAEGILLGAEDIGYDNAESAIQATTVQGAIDKVAEKVDNKTEIDDTTTGDTSTWSSSKIASEISAKGTKTQYRGSQSIDVSTSSKLTFIYSSMYASQAGCYMLLSNYNTTPLLIELGKFPQSSFNVTATNKSFGVDTITVTTASDEYSWYVLQF